MNQILATWLMNNIATWQTVTINGIDIQVGVLNTLPENNILVVATEKNAITSIIKVEDVHIHA